MVSHLSCLNVIRNKIIEQVSGFNYLGLMCQMFLTIVEIIDNKFWSTCETIGKTLNKESLREIQMKLYIVTVTSALTYNCKDLVNRSDKK